MLECWLNRMGLDMVQLLIRGMRITKPQSPLTTTVSALSVYSKAQGLFAGMIQVLLGSMQYKKINSPTLPPCSRLPCPSTLLPYSPAPLSACAVQMSVFERFKRVFVSTGVCVANEPVILPCKGNASYVGIQSGGERKSQLNPFTQNVKRISVKNLQNQGFFMCLCVIRVCYGRFPLVRTTYKRTSQTFSIATA